MEQLPFEVESSTNPAPPIRCRDVSQISINQYQKLWNYHFLSSSISGVVGRQREQCRAGPGIHLAACQALIARLVTLEFVEQFT